MPVTVVTSLTQFNEIIKADTYTVFDFWAPWCGPCRAISPVFEKLSDEDVYKDVEFYKVDVDDLPDIAEEAGIRVLPTFTLFKGGQVLQTTRGAQPALLEGLLATTKAA